MNFVEHGARQAGRPLELPLVELAIDLIKRCWRPRAARRPCADEPAAVGEGTLAGQLALASGQHPGQKQCSFAHASKHCC